MASLSEYEAWLCECGRTVQLQDEECECGLTFEECDD